MSPPSAKRRTVRGERVCTQSAVPAPVCCPQNFGRYGRNQFVRSRQFLHRRGYVPALQGGMAMTQKKLALPAIASEKLAASADRAFRFTLSERELHEIISCVLHNDYD